MVNVGKPTGVPPKRPAAKTHGRAVPREFPLAPAGLF
jgi:hypothetical protein